MKKSTTIRRIAALLTAALLVVPLSATALAVDPSGTGRFGVYVTDDSTITFRKEIVLINNGEASHVYSPDITYTYTIAPATVTDETVTDSAGVSMEVNSGKTGGVTIENGTAEFTSERVELSGGTATISKNLTAKINLEAFEKQAGIYRYVITENVDKETMTAQSLSRGTGYNEKRYLDVYISNHTETSEDGTVTNGLKVSGYVIFVEGDDSSVINSSDSTKDTITGKTEGFVDITENSYGGVGASSLADTYYTYDLTVNVDILGSLANIENLFPVTISTDAGRALSGRQFDYSVKVNNISTDYTSEVGTGIVNPGGSIGIDVTAGLAKNDSITIYGLPANTRFNVTEQNSAEESYNISVKSGDITLENKSAVKVESNGTISAFDKTYGTDDDKRNLSTYTDYTTANLTSNYEVLTFTNTLNDVSLTGVSLRVAPYLILLGAGVLLGIVYLTGRKKNKSRDVL